MLSVALVADGKHKNNDPPVLNDAPKLADTVVDVCEIPVRFSNPVEYASSFSSPLLSEVREQALARFDHNRRRASMRVLRASRVPLGRRVIARVAPHRGLGRRGGLWAAALCPPHCARR